MITEAIILAGGLGTRLRSVVQDVPKCMAPINANPFLEYVTSYAIQQGIEKIVFAVGYKKEIIYDYYSNKRISYSLEFCEEEEPLGTGGGINKALQFCSTENILVLNGDTFMEYDLKSLSKSIHNSACSIAIKEMHKFDRYGTVVLNEQNRIISFNEKKYIEKGFINTGVYVINRKQFLSHNFQEKFSFEKDYLEKYVEKDRLIGVAHDGYFIDIGIPEDYKKAQTELANFI